MRNKRMESISHMRYVPPVGGRKRQWSEDMQARFAEGTFARIAAVLGKSEDRTDFVRTAVQHELERREQQKGRE